MRPDRGLLYSIILHLVILLLLFIGLPSLWHPAPEEYAITVDILPVTGKSNVKQRKVNTQAKSAEKTQEVKKAAEQKEPKPEIEKPKESIEDKKKPSEDTEIKPEQKPKVEEADTVKDTKDSLIKKEDKKEDVKKEQIKKEKQEEKAKKEDKKKDKKKEEKKKKYTDFDSLLKTLEDSTVDKKHNKKHSPKIEKDLDELENELNDKSDSSEFDPTKALSLSEKDAIKSQIEKHWNVPAGAKDAKDMLIILNILLESNGSVIDVKIVDQYKYNSGTPMYKAAVDSAVRAVYKASPLKNLPVDKYSNWKEIELTFNPSQMLY
ncbi:MAG: TonB C-terminal domain-containing protein [Sphingobacteriia bacterium]|nr:TonB C-terminal domain-containing protein [Sphingobacteriia bacterium]